MELIPSILLSLKTVGFRMRPKFGIKSQQNSQMIPGNSQQDQTWVGIQEFPEKPKKKIMEFFPNSPCWRKSWTTHSHRESWREKRERFQKNSGKRVHSGEKNQGKCQDSIGIFMGKKEGIERMESRNDWWEKKKHGQKANQSHPAENFGSQIPRENSISSSTCNRKAGKAGIPSFPDGFWWENGIFLDSIQLEGIFLEFPFQGNVVVAMPGFFWEYLGNAGKFQRGGIEEMLWREEGASGKRDRNLREPGIYPGFPYSRRIPGKSRKRGIRGSFFGECFPQDRGEGAGKRGEKKQSLAPGALPAIPKFFWSHPLGITRKLPGRKILRISRGMGSKRGRSER